MTQAGVTDRGVKIWKYAILAGVALVLGLVGIIAVTVPVSPDVLQWAIRHRRVGLAGLAIRHARYRFDGSVSSLLTLAIERDETDVVRQLIARGADVDAKDDGVPPLNVAVGRQYDKGIHLLLAAGAKANARGRAGETAMGTAASLGRVDYVEALLAAGGDARLADGDGYTPLLRAAQCGGSLQVVQLLVDHGASVHDVHPRDLENVLTLAARTCRPDVVTYLIKAGCDPRRANFSGSDPLACAVAQDRSDSIRAIVAGGVDVNRVSGHGLTPLMEIAASWGRVGAMQTLMALGADRSLTDRDGKTAADMARAASQFRKAEMLAPVGPLRPATPVPVDHRDPLREHVPRE